MLMNLGEAGLRRDRGDPPPLTGTQTGHKATFRAKGDSVASFEMPPQQVMDQAESLFDASRLTAGLVGAINSSRR